jgi:hypothetical protein
VISGQGCWWRAGGAHGADVPETGGAARLPRVMMQVLTQQNRHEDRFGRARFFIMAY